jgi:hypothetical protein
MSSIRKVWKEEKSENVNEKGEIVTERTGKEEDGK